MGMKLVGKPIGMSVSLIFPKAKEVLAQKPKLLQEKFIDAFTQLPDWEQSLILSNFQKVAMLMDAAKIEAPPVLMS